MSKNTKAEFELTLERFLSDTKKELNVDFPKLKLRIKREGGVQAIRSLLTERDADSFGFNLLKEKGRLDRSVEQFVINHEDSGFFTHSEIQIAKMRLK